LKLVIDNNVLISAALLNNSIPDLAFKKAKAAGILLSSTDTVKELSRIIIKEKFNKYTSIETRLEFLLEFKELTTNILVIHNVTICRDPRDNIYLSLALSGKADAIITGDADLLTLHPFCNIPIVTPKFFLDEYC
jgi:putative PIN family toxin of toxin-antitoxin system